MRRLALLIKYSIKTRFHVECNNGDVFTPLQVQPSTHIGDMFKKKNSPFPDYVYCTALLTKANFCVTVRDVGAARLNMQLTDKLPGLICFLLEKICSHSNGLSMSGAALRPPTCIQGEDILQFNH